MLKRGHEATSNEGSPMAKARPCLVARDPRSEEISSQSLVYLVNPENKNERKEVEIAAGISWRFASRSEKSDTLKRVDKRMLQWPLEAAGGRSNSKHTVMRENILTSIAQGNLCWVRQNQSFRT